MLRARHQRLIVALLAGALPVLAGCSISTGTARGGVAVDLLDIARERRSDCGPASLFEALRRQGIEVDRMDLEKRLGPPSGAGYSLGALCDAAEDLGVDAALARGSIGALRASMAEGQSILVALSMQDRHHMVFVDGFEQAPDGTWRVRIVDPAAPGAIASKSEAWLEERWAPLGRPMISLTRSARRTGFVRAPGLGSICVGESATGVNVPLLVVGSGTVFALAAYEAANGEP